MNIVKNCILCGSDKLDQYPAAAAPFLAERLWHSNAPTFKLAHCVNCDLSFYNPRLDSSELAHLYDNYRDENYQRQRQAKEPWYTEKINKSVGNDPHEIISRKNNLSQILAKKKIDAKAIKAVLDYGGDKGQFIPDEFSSAEKYVYEISGANPISGVKMLNDLNQLRPMKFEFIMCSHVLEHVPYPLDVIKEILLITQKNGLVYLEVPLDSPFYRSGDIFMARKLNKLFFYLYQLAFRLKEKPPRIYEMHEHINYFSFASMKYLLQTSGLRIVYMGAKALNLGSSKSEILCCLARS